MKYKVILAIIIILFIKTSIYSQSFLTKFKAIPFQSVMSMVEYKPDNYIVCGGIETSKYKNLLLKINKQGAITKIDTSSRENVFLYNIFKTSDEHILIVGNTCEDQIIPTGFYFAKIDTNFNTIWENSFDMYQEEGHKYDFSRPIIDKDSVIVFSGYHFFGSNSWDTKELIIYKFNLQGDSIGYNNYDTLNPNTTYTFSNNVTHNPSSGDYYVNIENDIYNSLCYKLNNDLSVDSLYTYYDDESFELNRKTTSKFLSDSTFITSCTSEGYMFTYKHRLQIQDTSFNVLNKIDLEYNDLEISTHNVYNNLDFKYKDFIYAVGVNNGTVLSCLDSCLNIKWQKFYDVSEPTTYSLSIKGVNATSDKGAIVYFTEFTSESANIVILKVDSLGNSPLSLEEDINIKISDYALFPNPASDILKVQKAVQVPEAEIVLYNSVGQTVLRRKLTENITEIDVADLQSGVYIYNIFRDGKKADEGKIIVE